MSEPNMSHNKLEKGLVKNINIMIANTSPEQPEQPIPAINNNKYNTPIIDTVVLIAFTFVMVGLLLSYCLVFNVNESTSDYVKSFLFAMISNIFLKKVKKG